MNVGQDAPLIKQNPCFRLCGSQLKYKQNKECRETFSHMQIPLTFKG